MPYFTLRDGSIEARQVTADDLALQNREDAALLQWCNGSLAGTHLPVTIRAILVNDLDDQQEASLGNWIVSFPETFEVYDDDTFQSLFIEVADTAPVMEVPTAPDTHRPDPRLTADDDGMPVRGLRHEE